MLVVSDLVGTLTTGSPVLGLVDWVRHNQSRWRADFYMARVIPSYFFAKMGLIGWVRWSQRLMITALPLVKEADSEKMRRMAVWSVDRELWPKRRSDVLERLELHRSEGARVIIASSVYQPVVAEFANRVGAEFSGTPIEINHGFARFSSGIAAGEGKLSALDALIKDSQVDVAYGDTVADIPLLESARHAVAVYPDKGLWATASERGWEILGERPS